MLSSTLVIFFILFISSVSASNEFTNTIPISRRSFQRLRALAGDFDPEFARRERQNVYQKYLSTAQEVLLGIVPAPENDMEAFVQSRYFSDVASDTNDIVEQVVGPINVSPVLSTVGLVDVIYNGVDFMYDAPISLGTPGQSMTFDVDTGSADLWVPSEKCNTCTKNQFYGSRSSTYVNTGKRFVVSYGSGSVYGTIAMDNVMIAGTLVQNQTFGDVAYESDEFENYPNDGIIGMAFGTIAQCRKPTLFENMMKTNQLKWPCFSIHLTRNQETGSEMCWGCYDPSKAIGTPSFFPVSHRAYWSIIMGGFDVGGEKTFFPEENRLISAIDTGTTFIYLPEEVAEAIYAQIPGSKDASDIYGSGFYTYPCTSNVQIGFLFGNETFRVHSADFNLGMSMYNPADCIGGIFAMNPSEWPSNLAIIGDEFLKSWYSVYDYSNGGRVGFAPSVNNQY